MSVIKSRPSSGGGAVRPRVGAPRGAPAARSSGFQYTPRTAEQVRERATRNVGSRDGVFISEVQFFTPRKGDNTVRILPPPPGADWGHYGYNLAVHYDIGADGSAFLCPKKMRNEPCVLCNERDKASAANEQDLADALKPSFRVAMYVIDRSQEGKGPLVWNLPAGLDKDIVKLCVDPSDGSVLNVDDPNEGYDLTFTREGEGKTTKYKGVAFARRSSPLSDDPDAMDAWLQYITENPVDSLLDFKDQDYIAEVFEGQAPAGEKDPAGEDKPAAGKRPVPQRGAPTRAPAAAAPGKVPLRGKAAAPPPPPPEDEGDADLPTYDELAAMSEDDLVALAENYELAFPADGFESLEALVLFVAEGLQIEVPQADPDPPPPPPRRVGAKQPTAAAAAAPAGKGGGWRDRLQAMRQK